MKSLRSILGVLTHIARNLPKKSCLLLANGLFINRLLYLLPMWGSLPMKDSKEIQCIINKCARMVLNRNRRTRTRSLMEGCGWLYFSELVRYHSLVTSFKIINFKSPAKLRGKFDLSHFEQDHMVSTTHRRIKISRYLYRWRVGHDWNSLPPHVREEDSIRIFKKTLRAHILDGRADITIRRPPDLD